MYKSVQLFAVCKHTLILVAVTALILAGGIALWADIVGAKPGSEVGVESFKPIGKTDPATNITIRFSNRLVSDEELNVPTTRVPFKIEPPVPGLARWIEPRTLVLYPDDPLLPATDYVATIESSAGWIDSNAIKDNRQFSFYTPPLNVNALSFHAQRPRSGPRQARLVVDLVFNYPISREQLEQAISIKAHKAASRPTLSLATLDTTGAGPELPDLAREHRLVTEPFDLHGAKQEYKLTVDEGFKCPTCTNGLPTKFEFIMAVPDKPKTELAVTRVHPRTAGSQGVIEINMSGKVPTEEAKNYVTIDPPVKFTVESYWNTIRLRGDFKPQAVYTVNVAAGLLSAEGTLLERNFSSKIQMGDLKSSIHFASPGVYLPRENSRLLELETVNVDTVSIEVEQVFANNLVPYLASGVSRYAYGGTQASIYGRRIFVKDFPLEHERNNSLASTLDVGSVISDTLRGVFAVAARNKIGRWTYDSRLVMLTDIGIVARMSGDYLMVWANSLSEAKPVKKALVKLFSKNNQLLLEAKTNKKGVAVFTDLADKVGDFEPYLITVEKDDDLGYLCFANSRLPLSDFDVDGRPYLSKGYEAFLYTDRGVYRPGETAHLVGIVRAVGGAIPETFPYLIKVVDPKSRTFREYRVSAGTNMTELNIDLPADLPTGRYLVRAHIADEYVIGMTDFLVEEFMPDRIKVTIDTDKKEYAIEEDIAINVVGRMLYGPPASGHKVSCALTLQPQNFAPAGFSDFSFTDPARTMTMQKIELSDSVLSDSGSIVYHYMLKRGARPPAQLAAKIWATVSETGGRAVSAYHEVTVNSYDRYLGVATNLDGYAEPGKPVDVRFVALRPNGKPTTLNSATVRFSRIVYNSMLQRQPDGSYRFVSEETDEPIDSISLDIGISGGQFSFTPQDYGHYRVTVSDGAEGHASAVQFYASGWGRVPWSMARPDRLELDLDKLSYVSGSVAKLQVKAPFSGKLLVTIEKDAVAEYFAIDLPENTAEIELPIEEDYAPNVYVTATLIRPASQITRHTPARAFGIAPLLVIPDGKHLKVEIEAPADARPNTKLPIKVITNGSATSRITVAAVDVGITQLTSFETPDPYNFFYGKRRPALTPYDLYSQVYPETQRAASHLSPPGGLSEYRRKQHLNPYAARRVNVVSLWSGIIDADTTGSATVELQIPQFNGQLALMAVAGDGDRFGSAESAVLVRDKIIIQESFPRFVAPNDIVNGLVTVFNGMDSTATITVVCNLAGSATVLSDASQSVRLDANTEGAVRFKFQSTSVPGIIDVNISAASGAERAETAFELSSRPARPLSTRYGSGVVTDDSSATFALPADWVEGTDNYIIRTSSTAGLKLTRNIEYLLRYPYGCVEQTTSRLFPMLYYDDLAKIVRPELFGGKGHEYFLAEGIARLLRMQRSDGAFAFWPGGDDMHNWPSIYASHFLVEAKKAGYEVDAGSYKRLLKALTDMARGKRYEEIQTEHRVYACYVLAKAGKLDRKLVDYLTSSNHDNLPAYSRYQLASALATVGHVDLAGQLVPMDIQPANFKPEDGGNLSSAVRTNAILMDLLIDIDPGSPSVFALARSLMEDAKLDRWYNTQATAFALAALGRFFATTEAVDFVGTLTVEQLAPYKIDTSDFMMSRIDLAGRGVGIDIDGTGACYYYWQASGVSTAPSVDEYQRGIKIKREYLDGSGNPIALDSVSLGKQITGRITIEATDKRISNVVISDLLPAGFEIENPRLATSGSKAWMKPSKHKPDYQDFRDDRVLLFVDLPAKKARQYYYTLRAIAAGRFTVPPIMAECMYNPLISGLSSAAMVTVVE